MIVGIPKEIKSHEYRIGMVPAGVEALVKNGHKVFVEKDGGIGSGISDKEFINAGAKILDTKTEVYKKSDMIIKVKEPL